MGIHIGLRDAGKVSIGDAVYIEDNEWAAFDVQSHSNHFQQHQRQNSK